MTRPLLISVIGFVVGLATATGLVILGASSPRPSVSAESSAEEDEDSVELSIDEASADSSEVEPAVTAAAAERVVPSVPDEPRPLTTGPVVTSGAEGPTSPIQLARPGAPDTERVEPEIDATERLANIFGAMRPEEAAQVLEHLDDDAVQAILFHIGDRRAAAVLGNFEPSRAARLSRAVLAGSESP